MSAADSRLDTYRHIGVVRRYLARFISDLQDRAECHDGAKLVPPEVEEFDRVTQRLAGLTYGSPEYKACLEEMGPALAHHYAVEDHHPEHFKAGEPHEVDVEVGPAYHPSGDEYTLATATCGSCDWTERGDEADVRDAAAGHERDHREPGGIHAMALPELVELLCDWKAASLRHDDGDLRESIRLNATRFGYGEEIERLLLNTVPFLEGNGAG